MGDLPVVLLCADEATQSLVAGLLRQQGYKAMLLPSRAEAIAALALTDPCLARTSSSSDETGEPARALETPPTGHVFLKEIARRAAQQAEREEIFRMLGRTRWNRVRTARLLNISYRALLYKMKRAGLERIAPDVHPST
jgi:transcriptional regulator with GAF, ATPase, and Fis domain